MLEIPLPVLVFLIWLGISWVLILFIPSVEEEDGFVECMLWPIILVVVLLTWPVFLKDFLKERRNKTK